MVLSLIPKPMVHMAMGQTLASDGPATSPLDGCADRSMAVLSHIPNLAHKHGAKPERTIYAIWMEEFFTSKKTPDEMIMWTTEATSVLNASTLEHLTSTEEGRMIFLAVPVPSFWWYTIYDPFSKQA